MEDEILILKLLCDAELKIQNLSNHYSITKEDLREQILEDYLEEFLDRSGEGLRSDVERLVERIVARKRYYGLVKKEEVA